MRLISDLIQQVRAFLAQPQNGAVGLPRELEHKLAEVLAMEVARLELTQPQLLANGGETYLLRMMVRHILPAGVAQPQMSRLSQLTEFGQALRICPHLIKGAKSVGTVVRAWHQERRGLLDHLAKIKQPHPPVRWESADGCYRMVEFIHPAHIAAQGVQHHNCLANITTLMLNRHRLEQVLPAAVGYWQEIMDGTGKVYSLTSSAGAVGSFAVVDKVLLEAEGAYGRTFKDTDPHWEAVLQGLTGLVMRGDIVAGLEGRYRASAVVQALAERAGLELRSPAPVVSPNWGQIARLLLGPHGLV